MRLCREAHHVAYSPDDPRGQDGSYAEDLGEGGARGLHLGFDALVEVGDLPVQRPYVAQHRRSQLPAPAARGTLGTYAAQDARCALGRELSATPAGEEVPKERVETV